MKKTVLLLMLSFNLSVGFTQTKYYYNIYCGIDGVRLMPVEKDSANYYSLVDMDTLISGEIVIYNKDGKVFSRDYYKNTMLDKSIHFYENGKKKYLLTEEIDTRPLEMTSERTRLNFVYYMKRMWDISGSKINMKDSCLFKEYYPNMKIMREGIYYKGFPIGTWKLYYQNGNLMWQASASGKYNKYFTDFILSSTGDTLVKNGRGKFTITYPNGKPSYIGEYRNGYLIGQLQAYFPNGQLWYQVNFKEDIINGGQFESYYDGKYESYYANGYIQAIGNYYRGAMVGEWKWYDKQGRLLE